MRSDNLQLPCAQPPTSSYKLQIAYVHCTTSNFLMVAMVIMVAMIITVAMIMAVMVIMVVMVVMGRTDRNDKNYI